MTLTKVAFTYSSVVGTALFKRNLSGRVRRRAAAGSRAAQAIATAVDEVERHGVGPRGSPTLQYKIQQTSNAHLPLVVAPLAVGADLEGDVGLAVTGILEGELDGTAVHSRVEAVVGVAEPSDTTVELAVDGGRTLGVAVALVQEQRCSLATVVGEL